MISFNHFSVAFGQLVFYDLDAGFTNAPHGWRYMVAFGEILPSSSPFCFPGAQPGSSKQLMAHNKVDEATAVMKRAYPNTPPEHVKSKIDMLVWNVEVESSVMADKPLWWQLKQLHCVPSNLRALICACTVMTNK